MKYIIEIHIEEALAEQITALDLDVTLAERAVAAVLQSEGTPSPAEVGLLLTNDAQLQELNRTYRGLDAPTDVLSFADDGAPSPFVGQPAAPRYLGDIAISLDHVVAQAAAYGHSPERELAYLAAHGALHLLGYDHERGAEDAAAMRSREEAAMQTLGLERTP
ncbi:MAG: rRNA maturation RNase YbeY [Candidatus Viridilinea halotolerans]|uniref:Endoribonuclease YbeY n=1 Tax=Candidatus Viridilinea halotolerans TaxID=2491704 RepID=A0A426U6T6_9CHLR|nr:MAG: rRNA maturation RNase YbeY [Candidatus Viridilinea halotolerans]